MLYKWHLLILLTRLYLEPVQTNYILSVLKHCLITGLSWLMHNDLHWLTVSQRIQYMVSSFLLSSALGSEISQRLLSACVESSQLPASSVSHVVNYLFTAAWLEAVLFCCQTNSLEFIARWFVGSSCWLLHFCKDWKTHLFIWHYSVSTLRMLMLSHSTNRHLIIYLLTYYNITVPNHRHIKWHLLLTKEINQQLLTEHVHRCAIAQGLMHTV